MTRLISSLLLLVLLTSCSSEKQKRLKWNRATTIEQYEKVGYKDPKWDEAARKALVAYAEFRTKSEPDPARAAEIAAATQDAVNNGCKDPLVLYLHARFVSNKPENVGRPLADAQRRAVSGFKDRDYDDLRKFYGFFRAGEAVSQLKPLPALEVAELMNDAASALARALDDGDAPISELYLASRTFLCVYPKLPIPRDWGWRKLEPELRKRWGSDYMSRLPNTEPFVD